MSSSSLLLIALFALLFFFSASSGVNAQGGGSCSSDAECLNSYAPHDFAGGWATSGASCIAGVCTNCGANTGSNCQCRSASGPACGFTDGSACVLEWQPLNPGATPSVNTPGVCLGVSVPVCSNGSIQCASGGAGVQTCSGGVWGAPVPCGAGQSCAAGVCSLSLLFYLILLRA